MEFPILYAKKSCGKSAPSLNTSSGETPIGRSNPHASGVAVSGKISEIAAIPTKRSYPGVTENGTDLKGT
jgi:hypothetical protein